MFGDMMGLGGDMLGVPLYHVNNFEQEVHLCIFLRKFGAFLCWGLGDVQCRDCLAIFLCD